MASKYLEGKILQTLDSNKKSKSVSNESVGERGSEKPSTNDTKEKSKNGDCCK